MPKQLRKLQAFPEMPDFLKSQQHIQLVKYLRTFDAGRGQKSPISGTLYPCLLNYQTNKQT